MGDVVALFGKISTGRTDLRDIRHLDSQQLNCVNIFLVKQTAPAAVEVGSRIFDSIVHRFFFCNDPKRKEKEYVEGRN